MNVHFSSKTDEWMTPRGLFLSLNKEFKLERDVCATMENTQLPRFWHKSNDGLKQNWKGLRCWMNPPYGGHTGKWIKKAYEESCKGNTVVCLIVS